MEVKAPIFIYQKHILRNICPDVKQNWVTLEASVIKILSFIWHSKKEETCFMKTGSHVWRTVRRKL